MGYAVAAEFDYYRELKVSRTATTAEIKKSYLQLIRRWHPDLATAANRDACEEKSKRLNVAYDCLSDATKRRAYDLGQQIPTSAYNNSTTSKQPVYTHVVYQTRRVWDPYTRQYREIRFNERKLTYKEYLAYLEAEEQRKRDREEELWIINSRKQHYTVVLPKDVDREEIAAAFDRVFAKAEARTYNPQRSTRPAKRLFWWETKPETQVLEFDVRAPRHTLQVCQEVLEDFLKKNNATLAVTEY